MRVRVASLFDYYKAYHEMDRPLLQWIGVVGCISFPVLYVLRRATSGTGFDDLWWRVPAFLLCLGLALRRWWPERLKPFYIGYSWWVVFYCLSFLMSYSMLRNHGGTPFVVNMVMGAVLVVTLADWRNSVAILLLGYALALLLTFALDPEPALPRDFVFAAAGSALLVAGGALSHHGQKKVELERMRRLYTGLAGAVAHEMRTPLAQVRHALDSIAVTVKPRGGVNWAPPAQTDALMASVQQGHEAIARGLQAIELTLKQLRPESLSRSRGQVLSAAECVYRAVDRFAYDAASHRAHVQVAVQSDFVFRADATAMELLFFNLLKNALYYLPVHPAMVVRLTVMAAPTPSIVVRDTGPGIPPEFMPHLFQEFETVGKAEGTGLGLSFCRHVMRSIGGDIQCRSELGRFTEFTLSFPERQMEAPELDAEPVGVALAGRTVLVVDDQALNRTIARALLGELGVNVIEAEHGQHALDLLQAGPLPDAVLMDVNMPGLSGIETTQRLRALPGEVGRVPVLALTANDSANVQAAAREAGMQGLLAKPIDATALQRALAAAFEGRVAEPAAPAPVPAPAASGPARQAELLNLARLDNFERLGMLHELLPHALLDLRGHLQAMQQAAEAGHADQVSERLHALVGLAGEVGAQALHARARERYAVWLEGKRPAGTAWTRELKELLEASEQALWRHCGVKAADPSAPVPPV